ncbi:MAG: pro-sigmaK processing inhibitor BofA family protein [Defluviitaleaceae bacterium]|nr:pro-sigmaK processing inhibitor BofA family protein [Defluviitaleaceae bacterium]
MDSIVWILLGFGFLSYLMYTHQIKWLLGVARDSACGTVGLLLFNIVFSGFGLAVGVNALTVLVVGVLGAPGFVLLYATQMLVQ